MMAASGFEGRPYVGGLAPCEASETIDDRQLAVMQMRPAPAEATVIAVVAQNSHEAP
jgi:hypothetical protein